MGNTNFLIIREISGLRDDMGVADTLIGAELYARRFAKKNYGVDIFFNPKGWGSSETEHFTPIEYPNTEIRIRIAPVPKVNRNSTV